MTNGRHILWQLLMPHPIQL